MSTLEEIKARAEGCSPAPWHHQPWGGQNQNGDYAGGDVYDANGENVVSEVMDADGALIEAAPKLVAALEAVEAGLAGLDEVFNDNSADDLAIRAIATTLRNLMAEALR